MSNSISITTVKESKVDTLDFDNIALGRTFTDHMFVCDY
jgi:branched-chain amino acid aminotransferase